MEEIHARQDSQSSYEAKNHPRTQSPFNTTSTSTPVRPKSALRSSRTPPPPTSQLDASVDSHSTYEVLYSRNEGTAPSMSENWAFQVSSLGNSSSRQRQSPAAPPLLPRKLESSTPSSNNRLTREREAPEFPRKPLARTKALLSRPFGRASLPPEIARKWVVEVSPAEWDADESIWKYRILLQRRVLPEKDSQQQQQQSSFTNAFTWRSLADFKWLEKALRQEFHGGLLLPDLAIALGIPVETTTEEIPVEPDRLRNWLSDVLNGVRGQGELIFFHHDSLDLLASASMECFLYSNSARMTLDALEGPRPRGSVTRTAEMGHSSTTESFLQSLNSMLMSPLELCVGPQPTSTDVERIAPNAEQRRRFTSGLPMDILTCQSRALATAPSWDEVADSIAETANVEIPRMSSGTAIHCELLEAEKALVLNYRKSSLSAMEKLNSLLEKEEQVGAAWKRFAVSLSHLFAYEKDVEGVRLGDSKAKRENLPFRKVASNVVDDCLRVLARQKEDRAVPALKVLSDMLNAYVADLTSAEPSVAVYIRAVVEMTSSGDSLEGPLEEGAVPSLSWEGRLKVMASTAIGGAKSQALRTYNSMSTDRSSDIGNGRVDSPQSETRSRLLSNELLLRQSLTTLCRVTPIRTARMAWRYLNTEATQCALAHSAAVSLRTKINVSSKDSVSRMIKRHLREEKEDSATELTLIGNIVDLGVSKELSPTEEKRGKGKSVGDREELSKAYRRIETITLAREHPGRWDAKLAMAIMEAVGVDDPNVRVEETTRELRMVRKYAIGLREKLSRCVDAFHGLQKAVVGGAEGEQGISLARSDFFVAVCKVFSGKFVNKNDFHEPKSSSLSTTVLSNAGIDTSDPFGWSYPLESSKSKTKATFTPGRVGDLAHTYFLTRDSKIDRLLRCISDLLKDYDQRIEIIEGFVYMECVGIQLEKFFNRKRTRALSAFEKKTDITAAMNVAAKKRLPKLLKELRAKLDDLAPEISQTLVKETKEAHLESKELKGKLHDLAMRRLLRARETSTERAITLMDLWAKEEELASARELKALGEAMTLLEQSVGTEDFHSHIYRLPKRSAMTKA
jgi:hypothetical protein